jgi:hypothetical protein
MIMEIALPLKFKRDTTIPIPSFMRMENVLNDCLQSIVLVRTPEGVHPVIIRAAGEVRYFG